MKDKAILNMCAVGAWGTNAYALLCSRSRKSVLIDPGGDPDQLENMLKDSHPEAILVTHSHPDHVGALTPMRRKLKVPVMAHPGAAATSPITADRWLSDGDRITFGNHCLSVSYTPGHCDDQVCYLVENDNRVIVGDTIFEGGPGKTWSPSDFGTTLVTLSKTVLSWSDDTTCYPGHGAAFRMGDIRQEIEVFVQNDHGNFFGDATWGM